MQQKRQWIALWTALALLAALLSGCGGPQEPVDRQAPAPVANEADAQPEDPPAAAGPEKSNTPETARPDGAGPEDPQLAVDPVEEQPETVEPVEDPPENAPPETTEPEESAPEEAPPMEAEAVPEDGAYTANVTLEGGTGRATVESPAALRCENGQFWAVLVWSSPNFDYMKVDGEKYMQTNTEGNSTFEIPVSAFDQKLPVIADTIAMSEPHEVEYTLIFTSPQKQ